MSQIAIIPEERLVALEAKVDMLSKQLEELILLLSKSGNNIEYSIEGVKNISVALGCSEAVIPVLCKTKVLGTLLWKPSDKGNNARVHLTNVKLAQKRYNLFVNEPQQVRDALVMMGDANLIEAYWQEHYNL